jgi:fibronectin type 3 domain-containing protein
VASTSNQVASYRIYYGTGPGNYMQPSGSGFGVGNTTSYRITGLTSGRTYYFAVTAVDSAGRESALSEEKSKSIP